MAVFSARAAVAAAPRRDRYADAAPLYTVAYIQSPRYSKTALTYYLGYFFWNLINKRFNFWKSTSLFYQSISIGFYF